MFKLLVLSVLITAACAMPGEYVRIRRSPHHPHHGGLGLSGSFARADSSATGFGGGYPGGFGGGYPGGYGGYDEYPIGYGGYPGGHRGHGGYGGYREYPSFGGGYSDASAQSASFGLGIGFRK